MPPNRIVLEFYLLYERNVEARQESCTPLLNAFLDLKRVEIGGIS